MLGELWAGLVKVADLGGLRGCKPQKHFCSDDLNNNPTLSLVKVIPSRNLDLPRLGYIDI